MPPPVSDPNEVTREFHHPNPFVGNLRRNTQGQSVCHTATMALHPATFIPEGSPAETLRDPPPSSESSPVSSPLSLTFSDNPYNTMPATLPAPQLPSAPPLATRSHMSDSKGSLQWEGSADSNLSAGQFLHEIDNKIDECNYTTERQKVNCLRNNITFGSTADEWVNKLTIDDKDTYKHLTDAFELQWPLTMAPRASKAERIATLKEWVLKPDELGKKVESPRRVMMWSHVKWATGLAFRVRDAEDMTGFLLSEAYNTLPKPVCDLIRKEPRTTYTELTMAVLALDNIDLKDAAVDYTSFSNQSHLQSARRDTLPPAATISYSPSKHCTQQQPIWDHRRTWEPIWPPSQYPLAPFRGVGPGALGMGHGMRQSPIPRQSLRDRPAAIRHQDLIRFALPHHPNTPDGLTAY